MKKITHTVSANLQFVIGFFLFIIIACLLLFFTNDKQAFLILNSYHNYSLDTFFSFFSFLGHGVFSIILGVIFLFKKKVSLAKQVFAAYLLSGILVQVIKRVVAAPRPRMVFESSVYSNFIDGVTLANFSGFPSGHTASAFALAAILAIHSGNKKIIYLYLVAAILVGYSRIYLGQHFLADIIVGSLIGVFTSFWVHSFMQYTNFSIRFNRILQKVKT